MMYTNKPAPKVFVDGYQIPAEITSQNIELWRAQLKAIIRRYSEQSANEFKQSAHVGEILVNLKTAEPTLNLVTTVWVYDLKQIHTGSPGDYLVHERGHWSIWPKQKFESLYVRC